MSASESVRPVRNERRNAGDHDARPDYYGARHANGARRAHDTDARRQYNGADLAVSKRLARLRRFKPRDSHPWAFFMRHTNPKRKRGSKRKNAGHSSTTLMVSDFAAREKMESGILLFLSLP
jgi:hypothetical protein